MYAMRGYGFTGEQSLLDNAGKNIKDLHERLDKAKDLDDQSPNLTALKPAVEKVEKQLAEYEKLIAETVTVNGKMEKSGQTQEAGAVIYE